jgi:hypothetical protein
LLPRSAAARVVPVARGSPLAAVVSSSLSAFGRPTSTRTETVDTAKLHRDQTEDYHPHACTSGLVYLTYTAFDEEICDEAERLDVIPCRRCAESSAEAKLADRS